MSRRAETALHIVVWIACAVLAARGFDARWIPHDEGTLAHSAERVLAGELPHRDFDDVYTGGLSHYHAAALKVFGLELRSLRIALLCATSLAFVPALLFVGARLFGAVAGSVVALLSVAWSFPNYFAGLPSWYNLILATVGLAALVRHRDTQRTRWLVAAGFCGGLSVLVKLPGALFLFAAGVWLVDDAARATSGRARERTGTVAVAALAVALFAAMLVAARARLETATFLHLFAPVACVLAAAVLRAHRAGPEVRELLRNAASRLGPLVLGALTAIGPFVLAYVTAGAGRDLLRGVFELPARRFDHASLAPPGATALLAGLPLVLLLVYGRLRKAPVVVGVLAATSVVLLWLSGELALYRGVFSAARGFSPVAVLALSVLALRREQGGDECFLIAVVTAFLALVQFPFASPIYFAYTAPTVALAAGALARSGRNAAPHPSAGLAGAFFAAFAVFWLHTGTLSDFGWGFWRARPPVELPLERAGLRVDPADADTYERVVRWIEASAESPHVYAAPDCPELYFLAARQNPTRTLYDFFDEPEERVARILAQLESTGVDAVIVNHAPEFSAPIDPALYRALAERYPEAVKIGRFEARRR